MSTNKCMDIVDSITTTTTTTTMSPGTTSMVIKAVTRVLGQSMLSHAYVFVIIAFVVIINVVLWQEWMGPGCIYSWTLWVSIIIIIISWTVNPRGHLTKCILGCHLSLFVMILFATPSKEDLVEGKATSPECCSIVQLCLVWGPGKKGKKCKKTNLPCAAFVRCE